jgi:hypothetical protein
MNLPESEMHWIKSGCQCPLTTSCRSVVAIAQHAIVGTSQMAKVFLHWRAHPVYGSDPEWAEKTRLNGSLLRRNGIKNMSLTLQKGNDRS